MLKRFPVVVVFLGVLSIAILGCFDNSTDPTAPDLGAPYHPDLPTAWAAAVTNQFFPLPPGMILEYRAETDAGIEMTKVEVLSDTKNIQGVTATAVSDQVRVDGELLEDTTDWFAQDEDGNVWYLGEATIEYLEGGGTSTEGSWEWGVDGALPGLVMWADPAEHIGDKYRQEFLKGEAEDWAKVTDVDLDVSVPYDDFTGVLETLDWSAFSPGSSKERKFYAPGIGLVLETSKEADERTELVSVTMP